MEEWTSNPSACWPALIRRSCWRHCRRSAVAGSSRHAEAAGRWRYWCSRQSGFGTDDGRIIASPGLLAESHPTGNIKPVTCESGHRTEPYFIIALSDLGTFRTANAVVIEMTSEGKVAVQSRPYFPGTITPPAGGSSVFENLIESKQRSPK